MSIANQIPSVRPEPEPTDLQTARIEAAKVFSGQWQKRDNTVRGAIHWAGLVIFWTFVVVGIVLFLIWAWHMGASEKYCFLTPEQRKDLQTVLLAGVGSSFVTGASKRWLNPTQVNNDDDPKYLG